MMNIKYIYTENGQQESIIIPIEFWNDLFKKFNLKNYLKKENYFISKYSELIQNLSTQETNLEHTTDFYSLFGSWQSEKTGDEINNEIYSSRNDQARNVVL